ncbi:MAG: GlxA family transcriptional regulator [Myxococcota bacterium]
MKPRTIGFFVFDGLQALDLFGPLEALQEANELSSSSLYRFTLVSADGGPIRTSSGVTVFADCSVDEAPVFHTLIVPGGAGARVRVFSEEVIEWLRRADRRTQRTGSVCTGLFILAATGLLDSRTATTHWRHVDEAAARFPGIEVHGDKIFERDGKYFTAAGVTAGIDVALALIEEDHGPKLAGEVARQLVVFVRRPGDQRQYSSMLRAQVAAPDAFDALVSWIAGNLDQELNTFALAERVRLGERQFRRRFVQIFGETPARYVERVRLDAAREQLVRSRASVDEVSATVGFRSADSFRRAFERRYGVSPSEYRSRFSSALTSRRALVSGAVALLGVALVPSMGWARAKQRYVCRPCGCSADGHRFQGPGVCPACGMHLEPESPPREPDDIPFGASAFLTSGYLGATVRVHTYVPRRVSTRSAVLLVIPGAGRTGASYRDAWVDAAERAQVVVAALTYPEPDYDFAAYHMAGVVRALEFKNAVRQPPNRIHLDDADIRFDVNPDSRHWLFGDFDRIAALVSRAAGIRSPGYDLFGHSAGGQILHRAAILGDMRHARRIVAANSGFYTAPDRSLALPLGLAGLGRSDSAMKRAFERNLVVLLGEEDDESETGGTLLRTPRLDRFGLGRLSRGNSFFRVAKSQAAALGGTFNWTLKTVPGVGHDFRRMSQAAAKLLYG